MFRSVGATHPKEEKSNCNQDLKKPVHKPRVRRQGLVMAKCHGI